MRIAPTIIFISALCSQGCYGYVKTYDGNGEVIAECREGNIILGFIPVNFWKPVPACRGSANPLNQTANAVIHTQAPTILKKEGTCPDGRVWRYGQCYPEKSLLFEMLRDPINK